ncbi:MAG: hypothetical protein LBT27_04660 [Prevotellaceae bacterium]|jgi:hypothetical protein|nr:hypothetical protein [Prevotellaceae bacterium]
MKKILILAAGMLLFASCISVYKNENRYNNDELKTRLTELEKKLDNNTKLLKTLLDVMSVEEEPEIVKENNVPNSATINQTEYNTTDNIAALNLFLKEKNYRAYIGYNFNTDKRGDDLLFAFRNKSKLRGFGIVHNGKVHTLSFQMKYELNRADNLDAWVVWNGNYIVFAINGGIDGDCGFFGYTVQGNDFITIQQTWKNQSSTVRYAGMRPYSEIVNGTYYTMAWRINSYMSGARINMQTGDIDFTDNAAEAKELHVLAKVDNLYYGRLIENGYTKCSIISAPQYYNILNNYTTIYSELTTTTIRVFLFSYSKRRLALIDFTDNIVRPIYLNGITDKKVPATLTTIPNFEYKGKYYIRKENSNYSQFDEIKVPYDLFADKYIKP